MRRSNLLLLSVSIVIAGLYSCTKTGATGATGAAGATGTANVMYSSWAALSMSYNSTDSAYEQTIAADSITQAVLDSGLVLSYVKYTNSTGQTQVENASNYVEEVYGLKTITLYSYVFDLTGTPFRYIILHGGTNVTGGRLSDASTLIQGYTKDQWKAMPYDKVITLLGSK